jgi:ribonuclease G
MSDGDRPAADILILAACSPGEIRAAAVQSGALLDYAIHRPGAPDGVGDRLRGRVIAHVPAMAGAFIALPDAEGFLPDSQGAAKLSVGDAVTVTITRAAQGGKGPRLSARGPQAESGPPTLLQPGPGAIGRLLAIHPGAAVIVDDPAAAPPGASIVARAWDDEIEAAVDALADPAMSLPGGGRASIHPTPALVAIDMDTGAGTAERRAKPAAQRAANLASLPVLARAIRLRNLSGGIVVDLAGMAAKARTALSPAFIAALADDPLQPQFLGFTALGLAEIRRSRIYPPLHEVLAGAHAAGLAALRAMAVEAHANPAVALRLRAAPDVVRALEADSIARTALADRTGRPLMMTSDPALPPGRCTVETVARG